jgi:hypothetical protein
VKQQYVSRSQSAFRFHLASGTEHPQVGLVQGDYWKLAEEKLQKTCEWHVVQLPAPLRIINTYNAVPLPCCVALIHLNRALPLPRSFSVVTVV